MSDDRSEDNFKLALLSIRELQTAHRNTEHGLKEVREGLLAAQKGLASALDGIDHVAQAQAESRDKIEDILKVMEAVGFNSATTHQRLTEVERRLSKLEESA